MSLWENILEKRQEIQGLTCNPVIDCFDKEECDQIDSNTHDAFVAMKKKNIVETIKVLKTDFSDEYCRAFQQYNEATYYLMFKNKGYTICPVPEQGDRNLKTPDYKISYGGNDFYLELKTLSFFNGSQNYYEAQDGAMASAISIDEQLAQGKRVAISSHEIAPYKKPGEGYCGSSVKYLVKILIEKITQNIKSDQFAIGDTILFIDMKQLLLMGSIEQNLLPFYFDDQYGSIASSMLWNVCFAHAGSIELNPIEFEGKESVGGYFDKNGILVDNPFIKAIVFGCYEKRMERHLVGFVRHPGEDTVANFVNESCAYTNDDMNSMGYKYLKDIRKH
jgi:hypothetical protein